MEVRKLVMIVLSLLPVAPVAKVQVHAHPPRHQPSAHLVNAEEDSVATQRDLRKGVLRVGIRVMVTVGRALQTTTDRLILIV
mgnify:CR=1 FL=1